MKIFITGTDTGVGKTIISSWICNNTQSNYWKPIQTGNTSEVDSEFIAKTTRVRIHREAYSLKDPLAPSIAALYENTKITFDNIPIPKSPNLIIEGVGGIMAPINDTQTMIDLVLHLKTPVIIVAKTYIGTINHTCLTIEALRSRNIEILGVILNGPTNVENKKAIEKYGNVEILAEFPFLNYLEYKKIQNIPFPKRLVEIVSGKLKK